MITNKSHPTQFDSLDHQIIRELPGNIRVDAAKIARAVGANERTIRKRISRLIELDAIQLAGIVNPRAFGYGQDNREMSIQAHFKDYGEMRDFIQQTLPAISDLTVVSYGVIPRILHNIDKWIPKNGDFASK